MKTNKFLTFSLHGLLLAIDTNAVREILWLPELTLIEECPSYIAGVVNMHGKVVPVMDLDVRFGHAPQGYSCSDRVIILEISECGIGRAESPNTEANPELRTPDHELKSLGIIVNEVLDVMDLPEDDIVLPPFEGSEIELHSHFVSGVAKADQNLIMILNLRSILDYDFEIKEAGIDSSNIKSHSAISYFCPEADPGWKEIFHVRAINLQKAVDSEDFSKSIPVAVLSLQNECLCVGLESVREFSRIHNFTPVPCCPEHIAGNMNLRGNVLTLLDIRGLLNMQPGPVSESAKVIIVDSGEFPVGIIVDEILDVVNLNAMDIVPLKALNEKFTKGVAPFGSRMMTLLDLEEILSWDGLIVNEEV